MIFHLKMNMKAMPIFPSSIMLKLYVQNKPNNCLITDSIYFYPFLPHVLPIIMEEKEKTEKTPENTLIGLALSDTGEIKDKIISHLFWIWLIVS